MKLKLPAVSVYVAACFVAISGCGGNSHTASSPVAPLTQTLDLMAVDIACDSVHELLYAAMSSTSPIYANQVVQIDLKTGSVVKAMTPTLPANASSLSAVALSKDGVVLFVATAPGTGAVAGNIQLFTTSSGNSTGLTIPLGTGQEVVSMSTIPNSTKSIAFNLLNTSSGLDGGTFIADLNLVRANGAPLGPSFTFSPDGTKVFGFTPATHSLAIAAVSTAGISTPILSTQASTVTGPGIHTAGGLILSDDGAVFNPTTGSVTATLAYPSSTWKVAADNAPGPEEYIATQNPSQVLSYNLSTNVLTGQATLQSLSGALTKCLYVAPGSVVVTTGQGIAVVSGLPLH